MKNGFLLGTMILLTGVAAWALPCFGSQDRLKISDTGSSIGVMRTMAKAFQKKYPGAMAEVLPSIGSSGGIRAARDGKLDIGLSSRPMKQDEKIPELREEAYGTTAFVFAVEQVNPTSRLTLQEINGMYSGKRTTWAGGRPIRLILRPKNDAYSTYLAAISPELKDASEKAQQMPGVSIGITDQNAATLIERTPGSFGVTSACLIAAEKRQIKGLMVNGVAPTTANVKTGRYPYTMTMHLVYRKDTRNPLVARFIDFVFSTSGRAILTQTGHIPLRRSPAQ